MDNNLPIAPTSLEAAEKPTSKKKMKIKKPHTSQMAARPKANQPKPSKPQTEDPNFMFQQGFLADVFNEKRIPSDGLSRVMTRFPPEPNGFLHIGHSKAISINFGFARYHGGDCYLRYDDTNPVAEKEMYFTAIEEMVNWLGFKPFRITYSSDYFDKLYELAEDLIQLGGAYVCHCTQAELKIQRGEGKAKRRLPCPHRDRPTSESLLQFRAMRDGDYKPEAASLRMKQNLDDGNPQMWDLVAYRIVDEKQKHHHRTGDKWRIYPTYDFTHCLVDSFEGITHSLCTTEFELSRVSYEWLCDRVNVYKPMQREYGRLSIAGTVLSKRNISDLVNTNYIRGWDDPRLFTLVALRRRGVPPGAILSFINELGVTKAASIIEISRFEQSVRRYLEATVPRLMLILDPIEVTIENLSDDHLEFFEIPFSKDPAHGVHQIPFTKTIYIDRSDFREVDSPDYFRLAPQKSVGLLKVPYPITATSFSKDAATGLVKSITAKYENSADVGTVKSKTYIQWVASSPRHDSPVSAEVRIFHSLFKSKNPNAHPDGFLSDINSKSEEIHSSAMIETGFIEIRRRAPWPEREGEKDIPHSAAQPETVRFQAMRIAYFCLDRDSKDEKIILNRIVSLKEDTGKG